VAFGSKQRGSRAVQFAGLLNPAFSFVEFRTASGRLIWTTAQNLPGKKSQQTSKSHQMLNGPAAIENLTFAQRR
jgi:hypothetical protein